jgi:hypothetical protein
MGQAKAGKVGAGAKKRQAAVNCLPGKGRTGLDVGLGLAQTLDAVAGLPLAAFLQQVDPLEAFEDVALNHETRSALETFVL